MTRVLLAEDDVAIAEPLARALRREGYDVDLRADGPGALALAQSGVVDLLVLDQDARHAHLLAAQEARRRRGEPAVHLHRARGRLPVRTRLKRAGPGVAHIRAARDTVRSSACAETGSRGGYAPDDRPRRTAPGRA